MQTLFLWSKRNKDRANIAMDEGASRGCSYCGRRVRGTLHWRESYRVDFHFMYTGEVEQERMASDDFGEPRYLVRLLQPRLILACIDCFSRPEVRKDWDAWQTSV